MMKFRKLRIAWSLFLGVVCVLLIVLWVRSCRRWDMIAYRTGAKCYWAVSVAGGVQLHMEDESKETMSAGSIMEMGWHYKVNLADQVPSIVSAPYSFMGFKYSPAGGLNPAVYFVPSWFLILLSSTLATVPWLKRITWRFSLRTLIIATTIVAVVLGLVVFAARK
jgi:Ca2+/Na+ antiporter